MWGVSNYRVFFNMNHGPNNHHLLVLSLQLHLKALKHDVLARRGLWDGVLLRDPGRRVTFEWEVGNHFAVQPSRASNPKKEWGHFVTVVSVIVAKTVGTQGQMQRNRLGLSPGMFELVAAKRAAHLTQLSRPHSVTSEVVIRLANRKVKVVVSHDAQAYVKQ
jgi:hypothetical protein